jgi:xeroderma pigmentosum group C-complementing protein
MKSIAKQEKDVYIRWRKLIKGLLIKIRVDNDYGKTKESNNNDNDVWASFNKSNDDLGGGGFLPEK